MTCESFRDLYELYRDGALTDAGAAEVRAHLEACADCREFEADAAAALSPLRGFPPGPYLPPPAPLGLPPWASGPGGAALLSVAFLLLAGGAWLAFGGASRGPAPATARATGDAPLEEGPESPVPPAIAAPAAPEAAPPAAPARLLGRLVLPDGSSLPGARVTVDSCTTETDTGGLFRFEALPPGLSRTALVEPRGLPSFRVLLPPLPAGTETELAPLETGPGTTVRIRVVGTDAKPIQGATVEAFRPTRVLRPLTLVTTYPAGPDFEGVPAVASTAGADGVAAFEDLPAGSWSFRAGAAGRAAPRVMETTAPGDRTLEATLVLDRAYPLEGIVLDEASREPVPRAELAWICTEDRAGMLDDVLRARTARADGLGRFRLEDLPPSAVLLAARRPGAAAYAGPVLVEAGLVPRVEIALPADGDLAGVVVAKDTGSPLADAVLCVHALAYGPGRAAARTEFYVRSGTDGSFLVPRGLPAGARASLIVYSSPRGLFRRITPDAPTPLDPPVPPGPVRFEVEPAGAPGFPPSGPSLPPPPARVVLRGVVVGPDGRPAGEARAWWADGDERMAESRACGLPFSRIAPREPVPVAADGSLEAEVPPLPASARSLVIAASAPGFAPGWTVARIESGSRPEGLRIVLRPGATLRGRVVDADGRPVPDLPVEATSGAMEPVLPHALTGLDGSFAIEGLPATPVRLLFGWWHDFRHATGPIAPGAEVVLVRLPALSDLEVRLRGSDGVPVPGLLVSWFAEDGSRRSRMARTGGNGEARLPRIPRVPFRIVTGFGSARYDPGDFVQSATESRPHDGTPVEIRLERGLPISGVVEGPEGVPLAGVTVAVEFPGPVRPFFRSAPSGEDGSFSLRGLPAGTHRIRAAWRGLRGEVEAESGRTDLRIRVEGGPGSTGAAATVEGRVHAPSGEPLAGAVVSLFAAGGREPRRCHTTGPDGRFSLPASRDTRYVLVARDPKGLAAYADGVAGGARDLFLQPGSRGSGIGGRVARPDGSPAAGAAVVAVRLDPPGGAPAALDLSPGLLPRLDGGFPEPDAVRATVANADGSFDLGSPPGRWAVFAGLPAAETAPGPAALRGENDRSPLDLVTGEGWTLRARVLPEEAGPPAGARVEVRSEGLLPAGAPVPFVALQLPVSGSFEVPGLPPGPATVVLLDSEKRERGRWKAEVLDPSEDPLELRIPR